MPSYKSNVREVLGNLRHRLEGIETETVSKIVRTIATDLVGSNLTRIHNEGKTVSGEAIGGGKYSESYEKFRKKNNKKTDFVNLSFSGKLSKEFNQDAVSDTEIGIGFTTQYAAEISEHLEEKYGKVWGVTQEDEQVAEEITKDEINKALNG
jgi:hypothetical protein